MPGITFCIRHDDGVNWSTPVLGFVLGVLISTVTAPVGVSGAVFLLPVQLSVLAVPNPAVTPTNLLFNVVSGPGALARYRRHGILTGPLTRLLLIGTLPGVVTGAAIRVFIVPGPQVFRLVVAALLLPLGLWLSTRAIHPAKPTHPPAGREPSQQAISGLGFVVGAVGGIYGIGGGSILGPILVGRGMPITRVAPAALASTFITSIVGTATYGLLALATPGDIAPNWTIGISCGLGGLLGGYAGARLQPHLPDRGLRLLLGTLATGLAILYVLQAVA